MSCSVSRRFTALLSLSALLFCLSLVVGQRAYAELGPAETVQRLMAQMKRQGSPAPSLELYHWPSVYEEMSPEEREAFGAASPTALEASMKSFFEKPEEFFMQRMRANMGSLPPEQAAMMDGMFKPMVESIAEQMKESNAKLQETDFSVKEKSVDGDKAVIEVRTSHPSDGTETQDLRMQRIDGRWYLLDTIRAGASPTDAG